MKRTLLILGGIALLMIFLITRLVFVHKNHLETEREWFAQELRYEFSATVDSIRMFNGAGGRLQCHFTAGNLYVNREDSLKKFFKHHAMLYLIFRHKGDSLSMILPFANQIKKGDSLRISSAENSVKVFRERELITTQSFSASLTGYGSSPFKRRN